MACCFCCSFAMKHDTKHNECQSPPDEMYVMAPHLSWDLTPTRWSSCSRESVTKFFESVVNVSNLFHLNLLLFIMTFFFSPYKSPWAHVQMVGLLRFMS